MVLTEQQKRWNQHIEKLLKHKVDKISGYYNNDECGQVILDLYEEFKDSILKSINWGANIIEKSNYISFKSKKRNQNFVDIQIQKFTIKCIINLKKSNILGKNNFLRDVSKIGHFGSGDYEATIRSKQDIPFCLPFIIESYKVNS